MKSIELFTYRYSTDYNHTIYASRSAPVNVCSHNRSTALYKVDYSALYLEFTRYKKLTQATRSRKTFRSRPSKVSVLSQTEILMSPLWSCGIVGRSWSRTDKQMSRSHLGLVPLVLVYISDIR